MKLQVLGKYGRFPLADSGTSAFLVYSGHERFILDMGCSALSKMQKFIDINEISAVVLTHLHGDHIADFKAFTYMASIMKKEGRLKNNITVYLPKTPEIFYKDLIQTNGINFKIMTDKMKDRIGGSTLEFYQTSHPIETYGVKILYNGKSIAYTSDTWLCPNLSNLLSNVDLAIGDACILEENHNAKSLHISVRDLAKVSKESGVKKLMLAHLPDYDLDKILKEAQSELENSILAEENVEYTV